MVVNLGQNWEIMCWMYAVEVVIWLFFYLKKLETVARLFFFHLYVFVLFFIFSLFHLLFKKLQVVGLDFSKEQLSIASSRQHSKSKICYRNIK